VDLTEFGKKENNMSHSVSEQAARSVKKSEKNRLLERTTDQIIKDIRNNLSAKLAVTPDDVRTLLAEYDKAKNEKEGTIQPSDSRASD
jgi:hypothetical protein